MTSLVHIATSDPTTGIDQQRKSLMWSSPPLNPNYRKDLVSTPAGWETQINIFSIAFQDYLDDFRCGPFFFEL